MPQFIFLDLRGADVRLTKKIWKSSAFILDKFHSCKLWTLLFKKDCSEIVIQKIYLFRTKFFS